MCSRIFRHRAKGSEVELSTPEGVALCDGIMPTEPDTSRGGDLVRPAPTCDLTSGDSKLMKHEQSDSLTDQRSRPHRCSSSRNIGDVEVIRAGLLSINSNPPVCNHPIQRNSCVSAPLLENRIGRGEVQTPAWSDG